MEGHPDGIGHFGYGKQRFDRSDSKKAVEGKSFPDADGLVKRSLIEQRFVGVGFGNSFQGEFDDEEKRRQV